MKEQMELLEALAEFKQSLAGKSLEEIKAMELEVVKEAEAMDKEASGKTFTISVSATERAAMGTAIAEFLAKSSANWNQALALNFIINFWKSKADSVSYPVLDTTLRTLGQVQYSGIKEFNLVEKVNEFFETLRAEFMEFTNKLYDVAQRHEILLKTIDEMEEDEKPDTTE